MMSNDDLVELASKIGARVWHGVNYFYHFQEEQLSQFASLIEAKQSARIAELEAQLAGFEVVNLNEDEAVAFIGANFDSYNEQEKRFSLTAHDIASALYEAQLFALKDEK